MVPFFLFPLVGLYIGGMLRPIVFPIVGVVFQPVLLGIPMVGLVVRISAHLFPLPEGLLGPLALRAATVLLVLDPGIWKKNRLAMPTSFPVHGFPPGETINRTSILGNGRKLKNGDDGRRKRKKIDPWPGSTPVLLDYFLTKVNGRLTDW